MSSVNKDVILQLLQYGKPERAANYSYKPRGFLFLSNSVVDLNHEYTVYGYKGTQSTVIIPAKIGKKQVTAIGIPERANLAYYTQFDFWDVETLIIPEGVNKISRGALTCENKLKHIYLPESLTTFASEHAIHHDEDITVYCKKNSKVAQRLAETYGLQCVLIDD